MSSRTAPAGTARPGAPRGLTAVAAATALLTVAALGGLALALGDGRGEDAAQASGLHVGMAHVHGLGIDGGDLVAGTHYGAFVVGEGGEVTPLGPQQDLMGFTVVGPDHYLASGHPGAGQDAPGDLGLIESTDGGATWQELSLGGEADFHSLEARHGRVYGHSRGSLLVSDDGVAWEDRADLAVADLAVDPEEPGSVLATTEQGLVASADDARSFEPVPGAPVLVVVEWTQEGVVLGVDPQGAVHVSQDSGASWEQRGSAGGQPAALAAQGRQVFVATADGRILESGDGGRTFAVRYRVT